MSIHAFAPKLRRAAPISNVLRRAEIMATARLYNLDEGYRSRFLRRVSIAGQGLAVQLSERAEIIKSLKRHLICDNYVRRNRPDWASPPGHRDELLAALIGEMRQARKARRT